MDCCFSLNSCSNLRLLSPSKFLSEDRHRYGRSSSPNFSPKLFSGHGGYIRVLASQNQTKKSRKRGKFQKRNQDLLKIEKIPDDFDGVARPSPRVDVEDENKMLSSDTIMAPSRRTVLQACTVTSGLIGALGVLIRQSRAAHDRREYVWKGIMWDKVSFESWHLGLIIGSVILVSSSRFLLLKIWPDFTESSEAANQQVLASLEPLDYLVVAFLPGISEELLFRGALLPLFGNNWTSIFTVAAIFGVLHLGSGRKYSFAVWATLVGLVYGYVTILSSSIIVPMASHALNNLVGAIIWRCSSNSSKQI